MEEAAGILGLVARLHSQQGKAVPSLPPHSGGPPSPGGENWLIQVPSSYRYSLFLNLVAIKKERK
jgi:hypothetical protein